ncbi:MAG: LysR family transcriptional regulator, partial [Solobacterium sp.]|nr:LysR family transcriptional regulator [Solobacterium sp.]
MTLRHLEIFMAVCRTMSMSKAAVQLGMSQPAVSKAIAELEAFYNV